MAKKIFYRGCVLLSALLALASAGCQSDAARSQATSLNAGTAVASVHGLSRTSSLNAAQSPQSSKQYFIEFRSRHAYTYGHTFVVFGRLNAAGKMINPEVAGLAPKSDDPNVYMAAHVVPVPASTGWTDGDLEPEYMSAYWRVMLTEAEYGAVVADIRKIQATSPLWHAPVYNCNAFVGRIARSMGYKTPFHLLMPQQFVTRLREINGGPNAIGWTRPAESSRSTAKGSSR